MYHHAKRYLTIVVPFAFPNDFAWVYLELGKRTAVCTLAKVLEVKTNWRSSVDPHYQPSHMYVVQLIDWDNEIITVSAIVKKAKPCN